MLPWLMERGEVPLDEMAQRFGLTEEQLVKDIELVSMCGLPPYLDELIDVWIDEGVVSTGIPRVFTKPLRLTAPEGFALLAAARVAMQLPGADGEGALARALEKLAAALGDVVVVEQPQAPATEAVTAAAPGRSARQSAMLLKRLAELNCPVNPDDDRVLKEIALFAERCDISEEITRLHCHFEKFHEYLRSGDSPGRALDFLCQEIHREFNTIGSKANDSGIAQSVVSGKTELEKIREQVQNIE
jgi:hypothetical protein